MWIKRLALVLFLSLGLLFSGAWLETSQISRAQTTAEVDARRAQLQAELEEEEREIAKQVELLKAKQRDTATVAGEVELLKSQIAKSQAGINAKRVAIQRLDADIAAREGKIKTLSAKITQQQASLAELLRQVRDTQELSLVEVVLDNRGLTEVFADVDDAIAIEGALKLAFDEMRADQAEAREEQVQLAKKKDAELDAQMAIEQEKKLVEKREADKQALLAIKKDEEKAYQKILEERQRRAAQIRAALFALRDTAAIPFGKALEYATAASKKTGVRPAFLLAILKQESDLGANVGQCLLKNVNTGAGIGKNTGRAFPNVMKPDRDVPPFLRVAAKLGFDPFNQVVSCPQSVGYGGAMGPSQFIPSTWVMYEEKVAKNLGKTVANPWDPEDAFMASAIFLSELGAGTGSYSAERQAAGRYYAGGNWATLGLGYADSVLAHASNIQLTMIDPLQDN